jgi:hypothetical protein
VWHPPLGTASHFGNHPPEISVPQTANRRRISGRFSPFWVVWQETPRFGRANDRMNQSKASHRILAFRCNHRVLALKQAMPKGVFGGAAGGA